MTYCAILKTIFSRTKFSLPFFRKKGPPPQLCPALLSASGPLEKIQGVNSLRILTPRDVGRSRVSQWAAGGDESPCPRPSFEGETPLQGSIMYPSNIGCIVKKSAQNSSLRGKRSGRRSACGEGKWKGKSLKQNPLDGGSIAMHQGEIIKELTSW